jgi:hypothetical protein
MYHRYVSLPKMKIAKNNVHIKSTRGDLLSNVDAVRGVVGLGLANNKFIIDSITVLTNALRSSKEPCSELFGLLHLRHGVALLRWVKKEEKKRKKKRRARTPSLKQHRSAFLDLRYMPQHSYVSLQIKTKDRFFVQGGVGLGEGGRGGFYSSMGSAG